MQGKQRVIEHIRQSFHDTEHPGDAFLLGSHEGCEPSESVAPFIGVTDWSQLDPVVLDGSYDALSFFSEGGFRYFLPAYLIADLKDQLHTVDPVFHLTNGFSDKVIKPVTIMRGLGCSSSPEKKPAPSWSIWNINGMRILTGSTQKQSRPRSIASGGTKPGTGGISKKKPST